MPPMMKATPNTRIPTFALDYDNKTGRLLNLWVQAPLDDPTCCPAARYR